MSVDSKQFNSTVLSHEAVERHIRHAEQLRSEAIARGAQRLAAALSAGARRLGALVGGALYADGKRGGSSPCFALPPAASAAGRSARSK
jgi:hypothetical protein